jgi:hypothetical protein
MRNLGLCLLVGLLLCSDLAATGRTSQPTDDKAAKEADIRKLMELTGAANLGKQVMVQMIATFRKTMPQVPQEFWSGLEKEIHTEDMVEMVVPIYSRHFSHQDIRELIAFYQSRVGRKLIAEQPDILRESMGVGQEWGRQMAERVMSRLKEKGYMKAA